MTNEDANYETFGIGGLPEAILQMSAAKNGWNPKLWIFIIWLLFGIKMITFMFILIVIDVDKLITAAINFLVCFKHVYSL